MTNLYNLLSQLAKLVICFHVMLLQNTADGFVYLNRSDMQISTNVLKSIQLKIL
jgi:hypothetical protein